MPLEQLGMMAANSAINAGMGLILERHNDRRQLRQEARLQGQQMDNQRQMTDYNMAKQLQMWKDTNYSAQVEQLEKAGLNPGLLYGMSGGGGVTTGQASGQAQGGNAPKGGGEIIAQQGMGLQSMAQLALLKAQKENIEADTANKQADIPVKTATVPKLEAETKSLNQGVENQKAQEALTRTHDKIARLEAYLKNETMEDAIDIVNSQAIKLVHEIDILEQQKLLDTATRINKQEIVTQQLAEIIQKIALTKAQEAATNAGVQQGWTEISQGWKKLTQDNRGLDLKEQENNIKSFEASMKAKYPGAWNVIGRILNEAAGGIGKLMGVKADTDKDPKTNK